jgi:HSP20 family protein
MKNLSLYQPERFFNDLFGFRREFDEMFNRVLSGNAWREEVPGFKKAFAVFPPVEAFLDKEGKKYVCKMALPGVEPKDVHVHAQGNLLTVRGERKYERHTKETEIFEDEIRYGTFERTVSLPEGVNAEKLAAEYVNGVLEITAPVAAAALPRKIEIRAAAPQAKQIAA